MVYVFLPTILISSVPSSFLSVFTDLSWKSPMSILTCRLVPLKPPIDCVKTTYLHKLVPSSPSSYVFLYSWTSSKYPPRIREFIYNRFNCRYHKPSINSDVFRSRHSHVITFWERHGLGTWNRPLSTPTKAPIPRSSADWEEKSLVFGPEKW